jgi:hypothetical protein
VLEKERELGVDPSAPRQRFEGSWASPPAEAAVSGRIEAREERTNDAG